ncbi:exported hypothetical protein [Calderihabitans maritimus]|uniref:S-layer protein n=1 Tax=Calderihabitans maritimus TaxID=1246530 RepID=A0A1Z5HUC5_9FIRM|nr:exported hypothetical protein [Calderihabitans maritimus]
MGLIFSTATAFAATFSDVSDSHPASQAISRLVGLGVLKGYPDGSFKPNNNITRAEFAKIAVLLADKGHAAKALQAMQPKFRDVKANEWYTGYINLAASLGYVKGYPDGTYHPNDQITNAEVVTVLLRVLGYDDRLVGQWPANYLSKAAELGILDKVAGFDAATSAKRGDVAIMASEILDEYWVEYDREKGMFVSSLDPSTGRYEKLMEKNFQGIVEEDVLIVGWEISGNTRKITYWDREGYKDYKDNDWEVDVNGNPILKTISVKDDVVLAGGADINAFADWVVDLYIDPDDNKVSMIEKKNYGRLNFINRNDIPESHLVQAELKGNTIIIDDTSYTLASDAYIVSGSPYVSAPADKWFDAVVDAETGKTNKDVYEDTKEFGVKRMLAAERIRLSIDENGNVIQVKLTNWGQPALVKSVDLDRERIIAESGANSQPTLPTDLDEKSYVVESTRVPGAKLQVNSLEGAIEEGDVVYVYEHAHGKDYYILVYAGKQVEGTLESAEFDGDEVWRVTVDGQKYDVDPLARISKDAGETYTSLNREEVRNLYGRKVKLYLAGSGDVEFIESDVETGGAVVEESGTLYGVLEKITFDYAGTEANIDGIESLKIMRADGKEVYYRTGGTSYIHWYDENTGKWRSFDPTDATDIDPDPDNGVHVDDGDYYDSAHLLGLGGEEAILKPGVLLEFDLREDGTLGNVTPLVTDEYTGTLDKVDTDLDRVRIDGVWYSILDWTTIFDNSTPTDADVIDWADTKYDLEDGIANGGTFVYYKRTSNKIEYLVVSAPTGVTDRFGVLVAKGRDVDGYYADIEIGGDVKRYDAGAVKNLPDYTDSAARSVIRYSLSGGDLDSFHEIGDNNPYSVIEFVYDNNTYYINGFAYVKTLDATARAMELEVTANAEDGSTLTFTKWYSYDEDTKVWDIDDEKDDVEFVDINYIADGDRILLAIPQDGFEFTDVDGDGTIEYEEIKKGIFAGYDEHSTKNGNVLKWIGIRN